MLGITFFVFTVTRFVPGGPMDRMLQEAAGKADGGGAKKSSAGNSGGLTEDQLEELEEQYGLDKNLVVAYLQWLGVLPKEVLLSKGEFGAKGDDAIGGEEKDVDNVATLVLKGDGRLVRVTKRDGKIDSATYKTDGKNIENDGWLIRYENEATRKERFRERNVKGAEAPSYPSRAVVYQTKFSGLLQGNLGRSMIYNEPVLDMIAQRVPIAVYFGLLTAFVTYGVSLPLGVLKALKHRTFVDSASSVLIFIGYSIPGFALGALLLVHLGARMNLFPLFGMTSPDFAEMSLWNQVKDLAHHTMLPLTSYLVAGFAMTTMMTKNNLMDQLAADYVRTAVAKGVGFRRAVFGHAFRNSMIPIATGLGSLVGIFIGGSLLVETVFDIQGFGLLQYHALLSRDVPVIMGTLTISAFLMLLGNVISDFIVALVDPRIQFK
ncbi:MAG: ABC transporter permease subunit [Akkermansiaceae bacterium]|nr:ABC transporter permease subunit [Luteolibacter sp.]